MFDIFPLFSSVVSATIIENDLSFFKESIKNLKYHKTNNYNSSLTSATNNQEILGEFTDAKEIVLNNFNKFKNDVLRLESTDFRITTSWATKTETTGYCQSHNHKNSFYSCVLYLDDYNDGGELVFENTGVRPDPFMLNDPVEWNIYNFETFKIKPQKNLIVFFPSYLRHYTTQHYGSNDRYSVAVNFFPTGKIGYGDSYLAFDN